MQYLFQFIVLGFTAAVWWLARRDLARRGAAMSGPAIQEWERLQETVQTLIADLERRATVAEQRVAAAEQRMAEAEKRLTIAGPPAARDWETPPASPPAPEPPPVEEPPYFEAEQAAHEERYAPVYALTEAGVTDIAEIVRRTGLGHGEVELILGLHARQHSR